MNRDIKEIDAQGRIAGRLASEIALLLMGKHKPSYAPHSDCGDSVQVANVALMRFTGKKLTQKVSHRFTGYPGGIRSERLDVRMQRPERVLYQMVYNMLPANKLRAKRMKRLRFTAVTK